MISLCFCVRDCGNVRLEISIYQNMTRIVDWDSKSQLNQSMVLFQKNFPSFRSFIDKIALKNSGINLLLTEIPVTLP